MTALFCDLVGSTELGERLDAEVLRRILDRYHRAMRDVIELHGGVVEKFIGDAVVGVFGVPVVHEDDALRAVRAALEMCDAVPVLSRDLGLDVEIRVGIQSGETVADVGSAIGGGIGSDAFNTAARLQAMAPPHGVLLGDATAELVRPMVDLQPLDPASVKGKAAPLSAWLATAMSAPPRPSDGPIVGRHRELAMLDAAFEEATRARSPVLATFVAPPGVGKSRLGRAFVDAVGDRAMVLLGQTPSYGDGITFAPLIDLLANAAGHPPDDPVAVAETLRGRLSTAPDGAAVADRLAHVLGVAGSASADTSWAVRRLLETLAHGRPIVAILDDLHWAEPPMLDLVEGIVDRTHASLFVLCLARPDLLEIRPTWGGGRPRALTMSLPPLSPEEGRTLARGLIGDDAPDALVDAVIERSEGNPLFLEQIVARLSDEGSVVAGRWTGEGGAGLDVPPTIHALLASRLDRLDSDSRTLLAVAAVEGRRFTAATVTALAGRSEDDVRATLEPLEPRGFVEQEDASGMRWRFAHALIRDAAYQRLPKERRAQLHEELAERSASSGADDEAIARHLQQAIAFRRELLLNDEHTAELARVAGQRFAAAGERAYDALDIAGAATLLERAAALLPAGAAERSRILPRLGVALMEAGRTHDAGALLAEAAEGARRRGAELDALRADVQHIVAKAVYEATGDLESETHLTQLDQLRVELDRLGDRGALAELWIAIAYVEFMRGHAAAMFKADQQALDHATEAGRLREELQAAADLLLTCVLGPMTFGDVRAFGEQLRLRDDPIHASTGIAAVLTADIAEGRDAAPTERAWSEVTEGNGLAWLGAVHRAMIAQVELECGRFEDAERRTSLARQTMVAMGDVWYLNTFDPILAMAIDAQGRTHEFLRLADQYDVQIAMFDRDALIRRQLLRSRASMRRGALDDAELAARSAYELVEPTDLSLPRAAVLTELSDVLRARGLADEAQTYREAAVDIHGKKGTVAAMVAITSSGGTTH